MKFLEVCLLLAIYFAVDSIRDDVRAIKAALRVPRPIVLRSADRGEKYLLEELRERAGGTVEE